VNWNHYFMVKKKLVTQLVDFFTKGRFGGFPDGLLSCQVIGFLRASDDTSPHVRLISNLQPAGSGNLQWQAQYLYGNAEAAEAAW
jgi:hypothetical protein